MSTHHARRHQSARTEAIKAARRHTEHVLGLLHLRDRLARAAAEFDAHDLEGAHDVYQQQLDIEAAIRTHAPDIYEARWTQWAELDAALLHAPETPHPQCGSCQLLEQWSQRLAWQPPKAS